MISIPPAHWLLVAAFGAFGGGIVGWAVFSPGRADEPPARHAVGERSPTPIEACARLCGSGMRRFDGWTASCECFEGPLDGGRR